MEKRTILAFVLSFALLIGWSMFFGPKQEQTIVKEKTVEQPKAEKEPADVSRDEERSREYIETAKPLPEKTQSWSVQEKKILVDTPLYRAVFTNAGPTIKSFKLKKYHKTTDPASPLIELVNLEKEFGNPLLVNFDSQHNAYRARTGTVYEVKGDRPIEMKQGDSPKSLVFTSPALNGIVTTQTFHFYPDQYRIDLNVEVFNQSEKTITGAFNANIRALPPEEKKGYYSYVGLALLLNDELEEVEIEDNSDNITLKGRIDWMAYEDDYFISAVIPETEGKGSFNGQMLSSGLLEGTYIPPQVSIKPLEKSSFAYALYLGPRDLSSLKKVQKKLDRAVNFGWTDIIARPLLYTLRFFNQYINNYGVSIILLTILIKILFWPLTHKSYKSMKEMQKLQPRMAKLREKYKDNKEQLNKEMMGLYKTYKVNPMGGCLPMLIQIPVFFALFRILGAAIELRHAPFALWITDLSAPDRLFNFPFKIPFMSPPSGIPVLTLLMGASMFLQQKMTPTPGDPTQAKIMMLLPIIFTFMFINFPSGLVLYWLVNNILSIGQQYRIYKRPA